MRSPFPVLAALVLALTVTGSARAQGQLFLRWDDCADAGVFDNSSGCFSDEGANTLYCAFSLADSASDVVGIEVVVDLQTAATSLPPWWQMQGSGVCRDGVLTVSGDFTANGSCIDPWHNRGEGVPVYTPGGGGGWPYQPSQARILGTYAVRSDSGSSFSAGVMYYGLKIVISNRNTSTCAGCSFAACFVLNSITLLHAHDSLPPIETPGPSNANWATWMGSSGTSCAAVPVKNVTWGRLKTLYR